HLRRQGDGRPHLGLQPLQGGGVGRGELLLDGEEFAVGPLVAPAGHAVRVGGVRLLITAAGLPVLLLAVGAVAAGQQVRGRVRLPGAGVEGVAGRRLVGGLAARDERRLRPPVGGTRRGGRRRRGGVRGRLGRRRGRGGCRGDRLGGARVGEVEAGT